MNVIRAIKASSYFLLLLPVIILPMPAQTFAQEGAMIEEIVVTARRREESLQEVPVSVVAFTADELELRSVERVGQLDTLVPNVSLLGSDAGSSFIIRGVPGVATYVDGIWQNTTAGLVAMNVVEVERIEVLRGPQGTLFGKNTMGGALQYVTRPPADEFGARIRLTAGQFNRQDLVASVDVPMTDNLVAKFTGATLNRDGFIDSLSIDREYGDINDTVVRGDLLWTPNDNFSLRFTADFTDVDRNGEARVIADVVASAAESNCCGPFPRPQAFNVVGLTLTDQTHVAGFPGGEVGEWETKADSTIQGLVQEFDRYTMDIEWNINDNLSLRSITGYRSSETRNYGDFCACEYTLIDRDFHVLNDIITQEFQVRGDRDRFNWILGAYYWEQDQVNRTFTYTFQEFRDNPRLIGLVRQVAPRWVPVPPSFDSMDGLEEEGYAVFGELDFSLSDTLSLAIGFRQNEETNWSYDYRPTGAPQPPRRDMDPVGCLWCRVATASAEGNFDSFTPKISLKVQFNDSVMAYVSYAEGFGAGGVNTINIPQIQAIIPFDPEEVENFELGLRSDLLNNRIRLNATFFSGAWDRIQLVETLPDPTCAGQPICPNLPNTFTTNAGAADVEGLEIESILALNDNWRLDVNIGLLDTEYTDVGRSRQISIGDVFQQAPELTYSIGIQNDSGLPNGGLVSTRLDYGWVDDYVRVRERQRQSFQGDYGVMNARVRYQPPDGNWSLSVFGSNLTDERYLVSGFLSSGFAFDLATTSRPREIGASVNFSFD